MFDSNKHLIYGKFRNPKPDTVTLQTKEKMSRIESMRKLYTIQSDSAPVGVLTPLTPGETPKTKTRKSKTPKKKGSLTPTKTNVVDTDTDLNTGADTPEELYTKMQIRSGSTSAGSRVLLGESSGVTNNTGEEEWVDEADALVDWSRSLTESDPLS